MPPIERWVVRNTGDVPMIYPTRTSIKGHTLTLWPGEEEITLDPPPEGGIAFLSFTKCKAKSDPPDESGKTSGGK